FSSRRRHTRFSRDWSSDVCSSDLMTFFADLDVSAIDELPPGRSPILTKLIADSRRDDVLDSVMNEVRQGRQAYWVCPLVEESEEIGRASCRERGEDKGGDSAGEAQ